MELNKSEIHILKYLPFYRLLSIVLMIFSGLGIPFGLYANFFRPTTSGETLLNNALIGASIVVLGISYLMFSQLRIIEKLKERY
jgi:hypothetical protein